MKNKITCLLAGAALFGATANAEIVLADGLTASGYIDIVAVDADNAGRTFDSSEFELGLNFAPAESAWSAVAELSYDINDAANDAVNTETVAVTYQHSDALSVTFGQVYTYQGLESHDAPDNYFISYAGQTTVNGSTDLYSVDFASGVCVDYNVGDISLGVWTDAIGDASYEYYAAYTGIENLSLAVAIADNATVSGTLTVTSTTTLNGAVNLGDAAADDIAINGKVTTNIIPKGAANNLGDATNTFAKTFTRELTTGAAATTGTITGDWSLSSGSKLQSTYADLAEMYSADTEYEVGTVLVFGGDSEVTTTNIHLDHRVAGVVSAEPAFVMNQDCPGIATCIALQGRVPCKVIGKVAKGDLLVSSGLRGYAVVNNTPTVGTVIGKAVGTKDDAGEGIVEVVVGRT